MSARRGVRPTLDSLRQALRESPDAAATSSQLARALLAIGESRDEAIELLRRAAALSPAEPSRAADLGGALHRIGRLDEAVGWYEQAIALAPERSALHKGLGDVFAAAGDGPRALARYTRALELSPADLFAATGVGRLLAGSSEGEELFDQAERHATDDGLRIPLLHGVCRGLMALGRYREARLCCERILRRHRDEPLALAGLGYIDYVERDFDAALAVHQRALRLHPEHPVVNYAHFYDLCVQGDFAAARAVYRRWKRVVRSFYPRLHDYGAEEWEGQPLEGKTVLLHADNGFGDSFQFIRFAAALKRVGAARVVVDGPASSRALLGLAEGVDLSLARYRGDSPTFDYECMLDELWLHCETDAAGALAGDIPYFRVGGATRSAGPALHIGLAWRGRPMFPDDAYRQRSAPADVLRELLELPGCTFHSLQPEGDDSASEHLRDSSSFVAFGPSVEAFEDAAAAIARFDAVVTIDTWAAHLSGALGVPTFVMMPYAPATWRWRAPERESAWYPSARLFWQPRPGDWASVIRAVAAEIASLIPRN